MIVSRRAYLLICVLAAGSAIAAPSIDDLRKRFPDRTDEELVLEYSRVTGQMPDAGAIDLGLDPAPFIAPRSNVDSRLLTDGDRSMGNPYRIEPTEAETGARNRANPYRIEPSVAEPSDQDDLTTGLSERAQAESRVIAPDAPQSPRSAFVALLLIVVAAAVGYGLMRTTFFHTGGRLNRGVFAGQYFLLAIPALLLAAVSAASGGRLWPFDFAAGALMLLTIFPSIKRFHDLGHSGWWVITMMIPLVALIPTLYLLLWQGTAGANPYGQDPLDVLAKSSPPEPASKEPKRQHAHHLPADALVSPPTIQNAKGPTVTAPPPVQVNTPLAVAPHVLDDEQIYETVASEIESGNVRKGLWTKLWTELDGDDSQVKLAYIKTRIAQIGAEQQEARRKFAEENARREHEKQQLAELLALKSERNRLGEISKVLDRIASDKHTDIDEEVRLLELVRGSFEWVEPGYSEMCRVRYLGQYREFPDGRHFSSWLRDHVVLDARAQLRTTDPSG